VIALQLGSLVRQLGAQSFTGAASVLAVVREAGPIVTALIIAGAGGAAICADLGARKIREELDAMRVLGIDPIQRLVVPRVIASMLVAVLLNDSSASSAWRVATSSAWSCKAARRGRTWQASRRWGSCRT
jgi:phospholipid/cholesterol/gamma-HCH transport system permease protein